MCRREAALSETRKLATILSLDVVGYSAAAERDDSAAAEGVRGLRAAITDIVAPFSGRIFSSAGDGFMLEFPVATSGVQAAMALLDACKSPTRPLPQIRIGLHLGEVIVEENGDLLGHGVNIAARLQQRAQPGAMIVSQDVRRSVRGELAEKLKPMGTIKLDKMSETIAIYGFGADKVRPRWQRLDRRTLLIGAGTLGLAIVSVVAVLLLNQPNTSARTAVFTPAAPSADASAQELAGGIANEIVDTMSEIGLDPVSRSETSAPADGSRTDRAQALRAVYALDGDITRDGQTVRVSMHLDDVGTRQTVWSQTFEREAAHMDGLRLEVAAGAVRVLQCASDARAEAIQLRGASLGILLRICDGSGATGDAEHLRLARQLVRMAPQSSLAQARLAVQSGSAIDEAPAEMQAQLRREAANAVDAALRLNPHNGTAYAVKAFLLGLNGTRLEYERALSGFLQLSPDSPELNSLYSGVLRDVGRNREAVAYLQRGVAREPLSPYRASDLGWQLAVVGRSDEAKMLLDRMAARWPEDSDLGWARLRVSIFFGDHRDTDRLFAEDTSLDRAGRACWRAAADGIASSASAVRRRAALEVRRCMSDDPGHAFQVLAALGDVDGAFATGDGSIAQHASRIFFYPTSRMAWRDPRFMPLMKRAGLIDYWLESGHWPDFCAEPQLPYQCRAEALRLSQAH